MPLTPVRVTRVLPKALYFDGNDYVEVGTLNGISDFPFAVEFIVNAETYWQGWRGIVDWDREVLKGFWVLTCASGNIVIFGTGDGTSAAEIWLSMDNYVNCFTHFIANYYTDKFEVFRNGAKIATKTLGFTPLVDTARPLFIGSRRATGDFFKGFIAFVRIYSRALSEDEVRWNFYHLNDPVRDGLVLWLHWDSIDIDAGVWYDKSGYGNDGAIYGATLVDVIKKPVRILSPPSRIISPPLR